MLRKVITVICQYCFFNHGFKFQDSFCNFCHNLATLSLIISDTAIIAVRGIDYHGTINVLANLKQFIC